MKENSMPTETKNKNTYRVEIDKKVFHVISKFQGSRNSK